MRVTRAPEPISSFVILRRPQADPRQQWRVAYPMPEVLLLVVCGTISSCDDYEEIVEWGEAHLA